MQAFRLVTSTSPVENRVSRPMFPHSKAKTSKFRQFVSFSPWEAENSKISFKNGKFLHKFKI